MIRTAGLLPHRDRPVAQDLARRAADRLAAAGVAVRVPAGDVVDPALAAHACAEESFAAGLDVAVSLGGDGTMLRTVDLVSSAGVPVIGVNVGQLGFLTEVEPADLETAVDRIIQGDFAVVERMVLQVAVESRGAAAGKWSALNEAVIEKVQSGRLVRLAVSINGAFFTTYAADGVIVSTPTGSTAYAFSAGGPIVSPKHRCMLLVPVSPHMLFDRPLVLDSSEELGCEVLDDRSVELIIDGRSHGVLTPGDRMSCTGAPHSARFITLEPRDFHQVLKAKFGLEDR
jgi:NAD+ kinase